jgi:hypothetical protein
MTAAFPSPCCKSNSRLLRIEAGALLFCCISCRATWSHGLPPAPPVARPPRRHRVTRAARKPEPLEREGR